MKYTFKVKLQTAYFKIKRFIILILRRFQTQYVLAVYDDDLDGLLKKIKLYDKIKNGEFKCHNCGCIINRENLGVISNENNAIKIYCISTSCAGKHKLN